MHKVYIRYSSNKTQKVSLYNVGECDPYLELNCNTIPSILTEAISNKKWHYLIKKKKAKINAIQVGKENFSTSNDSPIMFASITNQNIKATSGNMPTWNIM